MEVLVLAHKVVELLLENLVDDPLVGFGLRLEHPLQHVAMSPRDYFGNPDRLRKDGIRTFEINLRKLVARFGHRLIIVFEVVRLRQGAIPEHVTEAVALVDVIKEPPEDLSV